MKIRTFYLRIIQPKIPIEEKLWEDGGGRKDRMEGEERE